MVILFFNKIQKFKIEIYLINLIILFYLFRTAVPFFKYPFLLLSPLLVIYILMVWKLRIFHGLINFMRGNYLIIILALIFYIAMFSSHKLYLAVFKDAISLPILFFLFIILNILISTKKEFTFYINNLIQLIIYFALLILVYRFFEFFGFFSFDSFFQANDNGNLIVEHSKIDYNFALLPIFYGIIGIFSLLLKKDYSVTKKRYYNLLLIIFSIHIFFSGSRRGIIVLLAIVIFLLIMQLYSYLGKKNYFNSIISGSICLLLTLLITSFFTYTFLFKSSTKTRNNIFEVLGINNLKGEITSKLYKNVSVFNKTTSLIDFYKTIWIPEFDSRDPDSGWGTRVHQKVFPLEGKKVEIVPSDAIGYKMDSTCNPSYYSQIDLCESYSLVVNLKIQKGEKYKASVYCFVSNNFDGNSVSLTLPAHLMGIGIVEGKLSASYDLSKRGEWQKLDIEFDCSEVGFTPIYLNFIKTKVKDFSKLNGYLIFAYPQYDKIKIDTILSYTNFKANQTTEIVDFTEKDGQYENCILFNIKTESKENSSKNDKEYNRSFMALKYDNPKNSKYNSASFLFMPYQFLNLEILGIIAQDPIRNWVAKFISEDTIYYGYKSDFFVDTISNKFLSDRILRWQFAWQIFMKEYNWKQKIFGGGFSFLNWYGYYFFNDKTRSDYPHNPFFYILLYSGVLGLLLYVFFMYKVFYYYIKYIKEYYILFIFFLITFFFSFFSAGNPFDPPIMGFFVILPFFIHHIHKKNKLELNRHTSN